MLPANDSPFLDSQEFVALDVETTGLDPLVDEIIEIAIVRFTRQEVIDSWSTLVRPSRMPGQEIVQLTGIEPGCLVGAPRFTEMEALVRKKIGASPIVGHSVGFDTRMLEAAGVRLSNPLLDTFRLSTLFLHGLPAYNLKAVATSLGIRLEHEHRALADTEAARRVFLTIIPLMQRYSSATLARAARYATGAGWGEGWLMHMIANDDTLGPIFRTDQDLPWLEPAETRFLARLQRPEALKRTGVTTPVDPAEVGRALAVDGALGEVLDQFETRPGQVEMAMAVTDAFNRDSMLLVEAGTGTGKSMAYLLPAALHALNRGERVVVSTDTRALQEQLYHKDVPDVQQAVERLGISQEVRAALLKGRSNYLCLRRWFAHDRREPADGADAAMRAKVTIWLDGTDSGDQGELRLAPDEQGHWRQIAAEEDACVASQCPYNQRNQCFLYRARRKAEHAHLVVANHSLLMADTDHKVLPDFDRLIIDEAHHLEDEATRHFGYMLEQRVVETLLDNLLQGRRSGQRGTLEQVESFLASSPEPIARKAAPEAKSRVHSATQIRARVLALNTELFTRVDKILREQKSGGGYGASLRITEALRARQPWVELEQVWEQFDRGLFDYESLLTWLLNELERLPAPREGIDDAQTLVREELWLELMTRWRELHEFRSRLTGIVAEPGEEIIYWIEQVGSQRIPTLQAAPLFVDEVLQEKLFRDMRTAIATSATLTIDGSFEFMAARMGLKDAEAIALGSSFDHESSTLLLLPDDVPFTNESGYQTALNESIVRLCGASNGRALVLFTSYSALRAAYDPVKTALQRRNIAVYAQGMDGGAKALVDRLIATERSVIFGTSSFWEGIDVPGDALSMLIITKLPFPVPSDPVFQARGELLDNEFMELAVPRAVLKFKQGFGRLIRRSSDRGICAVLDRRVIAKRYGVHFLHSLPPTTQRICSRHDMASLVTTWLNDESLPSVPDVLGDPFDHYDTYEGAWR
jgi:predicted DnaQ family exonuclease/DinG family helicase